MSKQSTSPWRRVNWNIISQDDSIVAKVLPWDSSGCREEDHVNANLIASAPELLEVLELVLSTHGHMPLSDSQQDVWKTWGIEEKARSIIAKAKGKSA